MRLPIPVVLLAVVLGSARTSQACPQPPPPTVSLAFPIPLAQAATNAAIVFALVPVVDYSVGDYTPLVTVSGGGLVLTGAVSPSSPGATHVFVLGSSLSPGVNYTATISDIGGHGATVTQTFTPGSTGDIAAPSAPGEPVIDFGEYVRPPANAECPPEAEPYFNATLSWTPSTDDGPVTYDVELSLLLPLSSGGMPFEYNTGAAVTGTSAVMRIPAGHTVLATVYAIDRAGNVVPSTQLSTPSPAAPASSKKSGCSCDVGTRPSSAPAVLLVLVLAALGIQFFTSRRAISTPSSARSST